MSLVVWLPLNGDLENQGLSNVTVTNNGATVDNNGKIGKCYNFNGTDQYLSTGKTPSQIFSQNGSAFSLCAWVYMTAKPTGQTAIISSNNYQQYGIGIGLKTNGAITFMYMNSGKSHEFTADWTLPIGKWSHIIMSYDSIIKKGYLYLDGKLKNTYDITIGDWVLGTLPFLIGKNQQGGWPGYFNGKMNDVRIYDHTLSTKEVKDLAKGLVLHYRLAGPGQSNLMPNTSNKIQSTNVTTNYNILYSISGSQMEKGAKYVYSGYFESTGTKIIRLRVQWFNSGSDRGGPISSININPGDKGFYYLPFTYPNGTYSTLQLGMDGNSNTAITSSTYNYAFVKLERGSVQTPWCPNPSDTLYSTLGYNNNIEYDCSGYRRNGTKNGTITLDADSPRYTTSYKMGGTGTSIVGPSDFSHLNTFTYSCWFNRKTTENAYLIMGYQYGNNSSGSLAVSKNGFAGFHCYRFSTGDAETHIAGNINYNDGKWHMLTVTYENNIIKVYVDGIKTAEKNNISLLTSNRTFVINYPSGSINNSEYRDYKGLLSDARVYATALSPEDIAELYHSAVIVDNTSKNYAYEYFEA